MQKVYLKLKYIICVLACFMFAVIAVNGFLLLNTNNKTQAPITYAETDVSKITEKWEDCVSPQNTSSTFARASSQNIYSASQLAAFARNVNNGTSYSSDIITLTSNIDLSGKVWTPIGTNSRPFKGTFNGNGYVISGLTINNTVDYKYTGLFGYTSGAVLNNVIISAANINANSSSNHYGSIAGGSSSSEINYCGALGGTITASSASYVGGLVGSSYSSNFTNCFSEININSSSSSGGIVGYMSSGTVERSYYNGNFSGSTSKFGGIAYYAGYIKNCWVGGSISNLRQSGSYPTNSYTKAQLNAKSSAPSDLWISKTVVENNDVSSLPKFILKGVGNIFCEIEKTGTGNFTPQPTRQCIMLSEFFYSTLSVTTESYYTISKISVNLINEGANSYPSIEKEIDVSAAYQKKQRAIKVSPTLSSEFLLTESTDIKINLPFYKQGNYKISAEITGVLIDASITLREYANTAKSATRSANNVTVNKKSGFEVVDYVYYMRYNQKATFNFSFNYNIIGKYLSVTGSGLYGSSIIGETESVTDDINYTPTSSNNLTYTFNNVHDVTLKSSVGTFKNNSKTSQIKALWGEPFGSSVFSYNKGTLPSYPGYIFKGFFGGISEGYICDAGEFEVPSGSAQFANETLHDTAISTTTAWKNSYKTLHAIWERENHTVNLQFKLDDVLKDNPSELFAQQSEYLDITVSLNGIETKLDLHTAGQFNIQSGYSLKITSKNLKNGYSFGIMEVIGALSTASSNYNNGYFVNNVINLNKLFINILSKVYNLQTNTKLMLNGVEINEERELGTLDINNTQNLLTSNIKQEYNNAFKFLIPNTISLQTKTGYSLNHVTCGYLSFNTFYTLDNVLTIDGNEFTILINESAAEKLGSNSTLVIVFQFVPNSHSIDFKFLNTDLSNIFVNSDKSSLYATVSARQEGEIIVDGENSTLDKSFKNVNGIKGIEFAVDTTTASFVIKDFIIYVNGVQQDNVGTFSFDMEFGSWGNKGNLVVWNNFALNDDDKIEIRFILEPKIINLQLEIIKDTQIESQTIELQYGTALSVDANAMTISLINILGEVYKTISYNFDDIISYQSPLFNLNNKLYDIINSVKIIENSTFSVIFDLKNISLYTGATVYKSITGTLDDGLSTSVYVSNIFVENLEPQVKANSEIILPTPSYNGYTFEGWIISTAESAGLITNFELYNQPTFIISGKYTVTGELFFYAVFKPVIYDIKFQAGNLPTPNAGGTVILNPVSFYLYSDAVLNGELVPFASSSNNTYTLIAWKSEDNGGQIKIENGMFQDLDLMGKTFANNIINFLPVWEENKVNLLYDGAGGYFGGNTAIRSATGSVSFGKINYVQNAANGSVVSLDNMLAIPTKAGYTFVKWVRGDITLVPSNNEYSNWNLPPQKDGTEYVLSAVWEAINVKVKYSAGEFGLFEDESKSKFGSVSFDTNNYKDIPEIHPQRAGYEFLYYVFTTAGGESFYIYPNDITKNSVYNYTRLTNEVTFTAFYKLVDFEVTLFITEQIFTYDAFGHNISANCKTSGNASFTYLWQRKNANGEWSNLNKTDSTLAVRNVSDSGTYRVIATATAYTEANGTATKTSDEITITINKKQLQFIQEGILNKITKTYDNTIEIPNNVILSGTAGGEVVNFTMFYKQTDVGTGLSMTINPVAVGCDFNNYVLPNVTGTIEKRPMVVIANGYTYQVGDTSEQIMPLPFTYDSAFLTKYGFKLSLVLKTNKNEVGIYSYKNNEKQILINDFLIENSSKQDITRNFDVIVNGSYEIKSVDDAISIYIKTISYDGSLQTVSFATISVADLGYTVYKNVGDGKVIIVAPVSIFENNKTIDIALSDLGLHWLSGWEVYIDGSLQPSNGNETDSFTINLDTTKSIYVINAVLTKLKKVSFNYVLNNGETLESPKTSMFMYQETIAHSIKNYGAVLPDPIRNGFTFNGWFTDVNYTKQITTDTFWTYNGIEEITLYASWNLDAPILNDATLDSDYNNSLSKLSKVYNATPSNLKFSIENNNETLNYTFMWQYSKDNKSFKAITNANNISYPVLNVTDSGYYKLVVTVTYKSVVKETVSKTICVEILPYKVFQNTVKIDKMYDNNSTMPEQKIFAPNGEIIYVSGKYLGSTLGSLLDYSSLSLRVNSNEILSNYELNIENIDKTSSIIRKQIIISFNNTSKAYDGSVLVFTGTYFDEVIKKSYDYVLETKSSSAAEYRNNEGINLISFGEGNAIDNFEISIFGTLTIKKATFEPTWHGSTLVTFNGKAHSLFVAFPSGVTVSYSIIKNGAEVKEVINAGTYEFIATFDGGENYESGTETRAKLIIKPKTIYISVNAEDKVYDGNTTVKSSYQIYADVNFSKPLGETITNYAQFEPSVFIEFANADAGINKSLTISFTENHPANINYTIFNTNPKGNIAKKDLTLTIKPDVTKQYNGKEFVVSYADFLVVGIVDGEVLNGNLTLNNAVNIGTYIYDKNAATNNLVIGLKHVETNYNVSISGSVTIIIAKLIVNFKEDANYVYTGDNVAYSFVISREDNGEEFTGELVFSETPIFVGEYSVSYNLADEYLDRYELIGSKNYSFSILKRELTLNITEQKTFDDSVFKYFVQSKDIIEDSLTLGVGDAFSENSHIVTTDKDIGLYYVNYEDRAEIFIEVFKDNMNVSANYDIILTFTSYLEITTKAIDVSLLKTQGNSVYNGEKVKIVVGINNEPFELAFNIGSYDEKIHDGYIHSILYVVNFNSHITETAVTNENNIKYAGSYLFSVKLKNYVIINDAQLGFTIFQKEIKTVSIEDTNKIYDGTNLVTSKVSTTDFIACDEGLIEVIGKYSSKNAGATPKDITLELRSDDINIYNSYKIVSTSTFTGIITVRDVTFNVSQFISAYTNKDLVIDSTSLNPVYSPSFINSEHFAGDITIGLTRPGVYDLANFQQIIKNNLTVYDFENNLSELSNYNILGFFGTIEIIAANIYVAVTDNLYVYDAREHAVFTTVKIQNNFGEISNSDSIAVIDVNYYQNNILIENPVNAGTYDIEIFVNQNFNHLYKLLDENGNIVEKYISSTKLVIEKRKLEIVTEKINTMYSDDLFEYKLTVGDIHDPTSDETGGLISTHAVLGTLSPNSIKGGTYSVTKIPYTIGDTSAQIVVSEIMLKSGETDVTENYNIMYVTATIYIGSVLSDLDVSALNFIYSAEDKIQTREILVQFTINNNLATLYYGDSFVTVDGVTYSIEFSSLKYFKNGAYTETNTAIDAGKYSAIIKSTDEDIINFSTYTVNFEILPKEITKVEFNPDKEYDGTSAVIEEITSLDICKTDVDKITILGTYMKDEFNPVANAGFYNIKLTLGGDAKDNYKITATASGAILAKDIFLQLTSTYETYYSAQNIEISLLNFIAIDANGNNVRFLDRFSGNVLTNFKTTNTYNLSENFANVIFNAIENIPSGEISSLNNYTIAGYKGVVIIKKAQIKVDILQNSFIYSGIEQNVLYKEEIYQNNGQIEVGTSVIKNVNASQMDAGTYDVQLYINSAHALNYELVNNNGEVIPYINDILTIAKREIAVEVLGDIEQTIIGENVKYNVKNSDAVNPNLNVEGGLCEDQMLVGTFTTTNYVSGIYSIINALTSPDIVADIRILSGLKDVTYNYDMKYYTATIVIKNSVAGGINTEKLKLLEYSAKDFVLSNEIYVLADVNGSIVKFVLNQPNKYGMLTNLQYNHVASTVAKNAGDYTVYLTIVDTDDYNNFAIDFTIAKKEVVNVSYQTSKIYDGTNEVLNISSIDLIVGDDIDIFATYKSANVGLHPISFVLSGSSASNYSLQLNGKTANIIAKQFHMQLKNLHQFYYTNQQIKLNIYDFLFLDENNTEISELANNLIGYVYIDLTDVGNHNLNLISNSKFTLTLESGNTAISNFQLTNYFGNIIINPAEIIVSVKNNNVIYNGSSQLPGFDVQIFNNRGELAHTNILDATFILNKISYTNPTNAGTYLIVLNMLKTLKDKYVFNVNGKIEQTITLEDSFVINKRDISVSLFENPPAYAFNGLPQVYNLINSDIIDPLADGKGGLISGHNVLGTLTTNSALGGTYVLNKQSGISDFSKCDITPNVKIMIGTSDVTANYNVQTYTATMVITSIIQGELDTSILQTLIYNKTDKVQNEELVVKFVLDGQNIIIIYNKTTAIVNGNVVEASDFATLYNLQYEVDGVFKTTQTAINAGNYKMFLKITNNANLNYEIEFRILPKSITNVKYVSNKTYDATADVLGNITCNQIIDGDQIIFSAKYAENGNEIATAGNHEVKVSIHGNDAYNYILSLPEYFGTIEKRNVTISVNENFKPLYNKQNITILAENLNSENLINNQTITGFAVFNEMNAGTHEFLLSKLDLSNLQITDNLGNNVISSYNIITKNNITIYVLNINVEISAPEFIYNGQWQGIDENIKLTNVTNDLLGIVNSAILISYNKDPINVGTYTAVLSSNNSNIIFTNTTTQTYKIIKREMEINIGDFKVNYNSLSDYYENLTNDNAINIVSTQTISGTFRLKSIGLPIGTYNIQDILFENIQVIVNGENVIENYEITSYAGTITILPYFISKSNIWLEQNSFVYNKTDVFHKLIVYYYDINGIKQTITVNDLSVGSFTLINGVNAINADDYNIMVQVLNSTLEENLLNFVITPIVINNISYVANKNYDGTSSVRDGNGRAELKSSNILKDDSEIIINGFYSNGSEKVDAVGSYKIVFEIVDANSLPQKNYVIDVSSSGKIVQRTLNINVVNTEFSYNLSGLYEIILNADNANVTGLLTDHTIEGSLEIISNTVGIIDLKTVNASISVLANSQDVSANYKINVIGTVKITKGTITLNFNGINNVYEYNANAVNILPKIESTTVGELPAIEYIYVGINGTIYSEKQAPINVGEYRLEASVQNANFEIINNKFEFKITAFTHVIEIGDIQDNVFYKIYNTPDPDELTYELTSIFNEHIIVWFTREAGEQVGTYNISIATWDNKNYNVSMASGAGDNLFKIRKAGYLEVTILNTDLNKEKLSKIYDTKTAPTIDISELDYQANGELVMGIITFVQNANVGTYAVNGFNFKNVNYDNFNLICELMFTISVKEIKINSNTNFTKEFDGTINVNETLQITDADGVLLQNYPLTVTASYANANVGTNIDIAFIFENDNILNYNVLSSSQGTILKREVTVVAENNQSHEYGETNYQILYKVYDGGQSAFIGDITNYITGDISLDLISGEKAVAGNYYLICNLLSDNLNIIFDNTVTYEITKKEIIISSNGSFNKVYDGTPNVNADFYSNQILSGDVVEIEGQYYTADLSQPSSLVGVDKPIVWTLGGIDGNNYFTKNAVGNISDKIVELNLVYTNADMKNTNLILGDAITNIELIYGVAVNSLSGSLPVPSHEGYIFEGWFLEQDYVTEINNQTIVAEPIWAFDEPFKTAYAKWRIKTFNVNIIACTLNNGVYEVNTQGGSVEPNEVVVEYYSVAYLTDVATANAGYKFAGYAYSLTTDVDDTILANGINITTQNIIVYAKFKPLSANLTLTAAGGTFTRTNGFTYSEDNTKAYLEVEYNKTFADYADFPIVNKLGYTFDYWMDEKGNKFDTSKDKVIDFYQDITLLAHYTANQYNMTLNANGGYFAGFNKDIWKIEETDSQNRATVVSKIVVYDSVIGEILIPIKSGFTFVNYDALLLPENIWQNTDDKQYSAVWEENIYNITVFVNNGTLSAVIYNDKGEVVEVNNGIKAVQVNQDKSITLFIKPSQHAEISVSADAGYTFNNWNSTNILVNNLTNNPLVLDNTVENFNVTAICEANSNTISVSVSDINKGYAKVEEQTTQLNGLIITTAKTGTSVVIEVVCYEGYTVSNWEVSGQDAYSLTGTTTDSQRTLTKFVGDIEVAITFTERQNQISLQSDSEKGYINIEDEKYSNYTAYAYSNSDLTFEVVANHGYKVDTNLLSWKFDTQSVNKGNFNIVGDGKTCIVTVNQFTADGTIIVPFVKDSFKITFVALLQDTSLIKNLNLNDIVSMNGTKLNSGDFVEFEYKTQISINALNAATGYTFYAYSDEENRISQLQVNQGYIGLEGETLSYAVLDNLTIYVVYKINAYELTFSVMKEFMGNVKLSDIQDTQLKQSVKYGYNSEVMTAVENNGYEFVHWVQKIDETTLVVSLDKELVISNVSDNAIYYAVFKGIEINISITLKLRSEDILMLGEIDFALFELISTDKTNIISSTRTDTEITYLIKTFTGEDIAFNVNASQGYEYYGLVCDPRLNFSAISGAVTLYQVFAGLQIDINIAAKVNVVQFNLNNKVAGAAIYEYTNNVLGVEKIEILNNNKSVKLHVKTGGDAFVLVYANIGYKIVVNEYFKLADLSQGTGEISEYCFGGLKNIDSDLVINIEILNRIYFVNFDYNGLDEIPFSSVIGFGENKFVPTLTESQMEPKQDLYFFRGWNTSIFGDGINYQIDTLGNVYSYIIKDGVNVKVNGFRGSSNYTNSVQEGIDYECTLYAMWELKKYNVNIQFVPNSAVNHAQIDWNTLLPQMNGRYPTFSEFTNEIIGIKYVPGSQVFVNIPTALTGYAYYGWSYSGTVTDKTQLITGNYNMSMPEKDITIYLYYTINVQINKIGEGSVQISNNTPIFGQSITATATTAEGYLFKEWLINGVSTGITENIYDFTITSAITLTAHFVGKTVEVKVQNIPLASAKIASSTSSEVGVYRVGDTINLLCYDITYGYKHISWTGEFSGRFIGNTYKITKEDSDRGYVLFLPVVSTVTVNVTIEVKDFVGGTILMDNKQVIQILKSFEYASDFSFDYTIESRYRLDKMLLNGIEIDIKKEFKILQSNGFALNNKIELVFAQLLWMDVREAFEGIGTEDDPYLITNSRQLAEMAYLVNYNIVVSGKISYVDAYYKVRVSMNLEERFWIPIGTQENPFNGTFEMLDYEVNNIYLDKYYEVTVLNGLFGYITDNAKIIIGKADFSPAIIVITSVAILLIVFITVLIIYIVIKRKRIQKLALAKKKQQEINYEKMED